MVKFMLGIMDYIYTNRIKVGELNDVLWQWRFAGFKSKLHNVAVSLNWIMLPKYYIIVELMILWPGSVCHLQPSSQRINPSEEEKQKKKA